MPNVILTIKLINLGLLVKLQFIKFNAMKLNRNA